MFNIIVQTEVR
ncbi:hypothetical protein D027_3028A, partial [Vibrio parahaemolyticus 861]